MSKIYPRFCIVQNFGAPRPATWATIQELMRSTQVNNLCAQIAALEPSAEDYDKRKSALKKQLPAITVHAQQFFDQKRSNESAVWNGLVCLEYDHLTPDEINAIRLTEPPIPGIILCGRSCSGAGVWLLIEVPNNDHKLIESTLNAVHEEYCQRIRNKTGLDISQKVDIQLDLARMRFLPRYDYIFWNNVKDFDNETQAEEPYYNMYADVIDLCDTFETQIPIGKRNTTYKEYMLQVAQKTNNTALMLRHIPDLGLSEQERMGLLNWGKNHIEVKTPKQNTTKGLNTKMQPIDGEALPFPYVHSPKIIQTLTNNLPKPWQTSAALCLLPALSAAAGALSYDDGKPLAFQVALYGLPQSGKTAFSAKPATIVQDYISLQDNEFRRAIEKDKEATADHQCPRLLAFTDTSIVQMMKYLQYAKDQTVMAYEGDLSSALTGRESAFLDIKKILRKGFDGETSVMDYKNETGFRGSIKTRLSALVVGTPNTIFNYFNAQATTEGNSRRVILVEHEMIMKNIKLKSYTTQELEYIYQELDYLMSLPKQLVKNQYIEQAAIEWRNEKQKQAGEDFILWGATQTPTQMFLRTAYLMYAMFHFDNAMVKKCCAMGKWVAEYQYRSYINNTYNEQKEEQKKFMQRKAPSTQSTQEQFNQNMYANLPTVFTRQDIIMYRQDHDYPHDFANTAILTRWKNAGLIAPTNNKAWVKIQDSIF